MTFTQGTTKVYRLGRVDLGSKKLSHVQLISRRELLSSERTATTARYVQAGEGPPANQLRRKMSLLLT